MKRESLDAILAAYALGAAKTAPLESADNDVFRVDSPAGRFVLRVSHPFAAAEAIRAHVRCECDWLEAIRSASDLLVPRPVRLASGERCGVLDVAGGTRVFVLFEWIDGEPAEEVLNAPSLALMGRAIARLHESSRAFAPPRELCAVRWDQPTFFGPDSWLGRGQAGADLDSPERLALVREAAGHMRRAMDALGRGASHFGLIHSDTHPGNMLVCEGDIAILDFHDCGFGHYLFDLGVMCFDLGFLLDERGQAQEFAERRDAVLAGYEQVAPLPLSAAAQLDALTALRALSSLEWIARSPDPAERQAALRTRRGVPYLFRALERFVASV